MDDYNFRAYCRLGKSEIAKINVFILDPKPQKNLNKTKKRQNWQACCMPDNGRYIYFHKKKSIQKKGISTSFPFSQPKSILQIYPYIKKCTFLR